MQDGKNNAGPSQWRRNSDPLNVAVQRMLPTPTGNPGRNNTSGRQPDSNHHAGETLHDMAYRQSGKLNPDFVCRLMGFPDGWLDLDS